MYVGKLKDTPRQVAISYDKLKETPRKVTIISTSLLEGFSKLLLRDERDCAGRNTSIQPRAARPCSAVPKNIPGVPFET